MRTENKTMLKFIALLALVTMTFWSCKDEINDTGYDLLLPGDLVSANKVSVDKASISSFTVIDEKLRSSKPAYNLLGTFVDPVFGKTTADFACQFRLGETPKFKQGDRIDSLVFYLTYRSFYGDTVTVQNFKAYELNTDLNADDTINYHQDIDLKALANSEVVGEVNHRVIHRDSLHSSASTARDTITIVVRMKLSQALAQKIMAVSDSALRINPKDPNIPFLKFFKGLYIEAGDLNQGGAIVRGVPQALIMYTPKTTTATDTTPGSVATYYNVSKNSARVNRFVHDYSSARFASLLNQQNQQQDSLIYLQTTGGLSSKIYIQDLNKWLSADSSDIAINKAELVLTVEQAFTDTVTFIPPPKLILSLLDNNGAITDTLGQLIQPADLTFSESYYGGTYNEDDGTYRFNLAGHLQQLIKERDKKDDDKTKLKNNGFYLTMDNKNSIFSRVVLKGATSKTGIRFDITYSRIK